MLSTAVPQDRFPDAVTWLFPLLGVNDREVVVRIWHQMMPPTRCQCQAAYQKALGDDDWAELIQRIPPLV